MKNLLYILLLTPLFFISSCEEDVNGCTDSEACNYNSQATIDNNSCEYAVDGYDCGDILACTDSLACNYNSAAVIPDDSCEYPEEGFDCDGFVTIDNITIHLMADAWIGDAVATEAIYGHISDWEVSNVTDMKQMFQSAASFNSDLSGWDVSNVTNMDGMFYYASSFDGDLSSWDVSNVNTMGGMFYNATSFNQDLSSWDVSNVTNMGGMFYNAVNLSEENQCTIQESFSSNPNWPYDWCE